MPHSGLGSIHAIGELLYGSGLRPWDSEYEIYSQGEDWPDLEFHLPAFGLLYVHRGRETELPKAVP